MNFVKIIGLTLFLLGSNVSADELDLSSPWLIETQIQYYAAKHKESQNLLGKEIFVMRSFSDSDFGIYTFTYHDSSFYNGFIGGTYQIENDSLGYIQFGLGIGKAVFKDYDSFFTLNQWVYWEKNAWIVNLYFEYIPKEVGADKLFWKYNIQRSFGKNENWFAGVYGERWMGDGPMIGRKLPHGFSAWASVPFKSEFGLIAVLAWSY